MWCSAIPSRSSASTSSSALSSAATNGVTSVSCEPTWKSIPTTWRWREALAVAVQPERVLDGDAELVLPQTGRDVRMRLRVDVGVHADRHRCALPRLGGDALDALELAGRLDVEAEDAGGERLADLGLRLADAGEHHLARIGARRDDARELAAGDDVEARAEAREHVEHGEVGVRLQRVAHEVVAAGEGRGERAERALERGAGVDEAGRAEPARDVLRAGPTRRAAGRP